MNAIWVLPILFFCTIGFPIAIQSLPSNPRFRSYSDNTKLFLLSCCIGLPALFWTMVWPPLLLIAAALFVAYVYFSPLRKLFERYRHFQILSKFFVNPTKIGSIFTAALLRALRNEGLPAPQMAILAYWSDFVFNSYVAHNFTTTPPKFPHLAYLFMPKAEELATYDVELAVFEQRARDPKATVDSFIDLMCHQVVLTVRQLPPVALTPLEKLSDERLKPTVTVRLADVISVVRLLNLFLSLYRSTDETKDFFRNTPPQLDKNRRDLQLNRKIEAIEEHPGGTEEIIQDFFHDTPLQSFLGALLELRIPFKLPETLRFEHHWIIAPSGSGKTNAIENLIRDDLRRVEEGKASVFVMDSQNEMIPRIASSKMFAPGGSLHGKLVVLEPETDYPLALNMFDMGVTTGVSSEERERQYKSALSLMDFVIAGLLGADLTAKQKGIFRYITQALTVIPDATINTFAELMSPGGYAKYRDDISQMDSYAVDFFENRFNTAQFNKTKEEIFWRLDTILSDTTFRRMFAHPRNKLDLFSELNSGKVILVNTKEALLHEATEPFGRFFIALLLQATERRMLLPKDKRLPVFAYIDECSNYIAHEEKVAILLDRARKQNVGLILAHQRLAHITSANVIDALSNVAIRFAGGNDTDASTLSRLLRTEPETIANQPKSSFSAFVRGFQSEAVTIKFPHSPFETEEKMTAAESSALREHMRRTYGERVDDRVKTTSSPALAGRSGPPKRRPPPADGGDVDTNPTDF